MQIITITSDWNEYDYYLASLKGRLLSHCPGACIIDISHRVKPFHTAQAAFLVRNSYPNFPRGTIHIISVNTEPEDGGQLLAARMADQYFLCADNGMLGLLGGPGPDMVVRLEGLPDQQTGTFISLSLLSDMACRLAKGTPLKELGTPVESYNRQVPLRPTIEGNIITGSVIHVDSYQNAITNISREFFQKVGGGRPFRIYVQSKHYVLEKINTRYNESPPGDILAIFNSIGLLEIAIRKGNAAGLLKLTTSSTVRIEFNEQEDA